MSFLLKWIQDKLNFKGCHGPQFCHDEGLGRVALIATILGITLGIHLTMFLNLLVDKGTIIGLVWCSYMSLLCMFHLGEFFVTAIYNPMATTADCFVVNHSSQYTLAVLMSMAEFWTEAILCPSIKLKYPFVIWMGLMFVIGGALCRQVAMATCGSNFHHRIQHRQRDSHRLVITGIYKYLRHPSYVGWFYWSIGTQLLICNPLCSVAYAFASWRFFKVRIAYEEDLLQRQYPKRYSSYIDSSWLGIPFIKSRKLLPPPNGLTMPTNEKQTTTGKNDGLQEKNISQPKN